jgi:Dit-like tail protein
VTGIIPFGVSVVAAVADDLISTILFRQRNIGGFVADVTVRESHRDRLTATRNPVEQGAAVTDHSFKEPAELTVLVGYSNSSFQAGGDPNYVQEVYQQFLALQATREVFDVITGKRQYSNMLMTLLATDTDEKTENATFLTVEMRELILVTTQTVTVPPNADQAAPGVTGATTNTGTSQLTPGTPYNANAAPFSPGWNSLGGP